FYFPTPYQSLLLIAREFHWRIESSRFHMGSDEIYSWSLSMRDVSSSSDSFIPFLNEFTDIPKLFMAEGNRLPNSRSTITARIMSSGAASPPNISHLALCVEVSSPQLW